MLKWTSVTTASDPGTGPFCDPSTTSTPPDSTGGEDPVDPLFDTVTIEMCRPLSGGKQACYLRFVFSEATILSFSMSGSTQGEDVPVMEVSMNFEEITVTYTKFDDKGAKGGSVEYTWKVEPAP